MKRLTKIQKEQLTNLQENKRLYVGYNCPSIIRTFNKLVEKGYAKALKTSRMGEYFEIV